MPHLIASFAQQRKIPCCLGWQGACSWFSNYLILIMTEWTPPTDINLVDLGFMDSRSKLIDLAAFLDRVQKTGQDNDFRVQALKKAITLLSEGEPVRAKSILLSFSDSTSEPIAQATTQSACGAVPPAL